MILINVIYDISALSSTHYSNRSHTGVSRAIESLLEGHVPVITSNTSSLPEVVSDAGFMVDPKDGVALCQAMLDIYCQTSLRDSLSTKSLERVKLFSWEKCAQQTVAAYTTALDR